MKNEAVRLNKYYNVKGGTLTTYVIDKPFDRGGDNWRRPAVIIAPGGGYHFCSKREQEVVALEFLARGYNAFVLEYLCAPDNVSYPEQLLELAVSVDYIKKNAKEFSINPNEIFAVGFSAGGHLVASLSTDYTIAQKEYSGKIDTKITGAGLIYPVISDLYLHQESHSNLFVNSSEEYKAEKLPQIRMDELVSKNTVPAFIFSTFEDKTVPSINALKYAEAMAKKGIPYELHVYKNGGHGMSIATAEINETTKGISRNKNWVNDCAEFFRDYVKEEY